MNVWWRDVSLLCLVTLASTTTPATPFTNINGGKSPEQFSSLTIGTNWLRVQKSPSTMPNQEPALTSKTSPCRLSQSPNQSPPVPEPVPEPVPARPRTVPVVPEPVPEPVTVFGTILGIGALAAARRKKSDSSNQKNDS